MFEPRRLSDASASRDLKLALREARAAQPSPAELARLAERVRGRLAIDGSNAASATPVGAAALGVKGLLLLGLLAISAAFGWRVAKHRSVAMHDGAAAAAHAPAVAVAGPAAWRASATQSRPPAALPSAVESAAPEPMPAARPTLQAPKARSAIARDARARGNNERSAASEVALIADAAQQLIRDPERALALLDEHERRFPRGLLCEERESLRIDALFAAGRRAAARQAAASFVQRFPRSAHVPRLQHMLEPRAGAAADHNRGHDATPTE